MASQSQDKVSAKVKQQASLAAKRRRATIAWVATVVLIIAGIGFGIKAGTDAQAMDLAKIATNLVVAETKLRVMSVRQARDVTFVTGMSAIADRTSAVGSVWDSYSRDKVAAEVQAALVKAAADPAYRPLQSAKFVIQRLDESKIIDDTSAEVRVNGVLIEYIDGIWQRTLQGDWVLQLSRFSAETPWLLHDKLAPPPIIPG